MKRKNAVLLIILAVVFIGLSIGLFEINFIPKAADKKVLQNGVETTATVESVYSNTKINGKPYYYIEFIYKNEKGEYITAKTNAAYTFEKLLNMNVIYYDTIYNDYYIPENATIQIKYLGNKAVAKDYVESKSNSIMYIVSGIFLLFGLIAFATSISIFVKKGKYNKLLKTGVEGEGRFMSKKVGISVNREKYYKIKFSFTNENGQFTEYETDAIYRELEANVIETMKTFPIKYKGKKAIINLSNQELLDAQRNYSDSSFYIR